MPPPLPMRSGELRAAIETLYDWGGQSQLARTLGVNPRSVRRWLAGTAPIPGPVAVAVRQMVEFRQGQPPRRYGSQE